MTRGALPIGAARLLVLLASGLLSGSCSGSPAGFSAVGGSSAGGAGAKAGAGGSAAAQAGGQSGSSSASAGSGAADASSAGEAGSDAGQPSGGTDPSAAGASSAGHAGKGGSAGTAGAGGSQGGSGGMAGAGSSDDCLLASYQGNAYAFCGVVPSADAARSKCAALGMDMVGIESAGENAFVLATMTGSSWLGASDQDEQQRWRWLGTGMLFWDEGPLPDAYQDFAPGNPNNNGPNQTNEDCLVIFRGDSDAGGHWNDLACDFEFYRAACEARLP